MPVPGLQYMKDKDILSKNPAGSGLIGKTAVLVDRALGPAPDKREDVARGRRVATT